MNAIYQNLSYNTNSPLWITFQFRAKTQKNRENINLVCKI
jgi:hypothetical protein